MDNNPQKDNLLILADRFNEILNELAKKYKTLNKQEIEDAVQNALLELCRIRSSLLNNEKTARDAYLYLRRVAINNCNKKYKEKKKTLSYNESLNLKQESFMSPTDKNEKIKKCRFLIEKLAPRQQSVIIYKYQKGMSYREISKIMNVSEGTVKATCNQAIKKMKQLLRKIEKNYN